MTRGQLVIAAGLVIAVGLLAVLGAVLQLGYDPEATSPREDGTAETRRVVESVLTNLEPAVREHDWGENDRAAKLVADGLRGPLAALEEARPGVTRIVMLDTRAAAQGLLEVCPRGPNLRFGPCVAVDGVVLQEREDTTHLVGVAIRIVTVTETGRSEITLYIRPMPRIVVVATEA
jgi:hypothetical protein